jgi:hypothetical protein
MASALLPSDGFSLSRLVEGLEVPEGHGTVDEGSHLPVREALRIEVPIVLLVQDLLLDVVLGPLLCSFRVTAFVGSSPLGRATSKVGGISLRGDSRQPRPLH